MKHNFSLFLISSILLCAATPTLVVQGSAEPPPCADRSVTAGAVRTTEDVKSFVQCAYEFVQEVGFEEARRAFHEDERWRCQGRSKFGPLRRSKSRPVGEGVAVFVGRLERSLRSPFRAAQA